MASSVQGLLEELEAIEEDLPEDVQDEVADHRSALEDALASGAVLEAGREAADTLEDEAWIEEAAVATTDTDSATLIVRFDTDAALATLSEAQPPAASPDTPNQSPDDHSDDESGASDETLEGDILDVLDEHGELPAADIRKRLHAGESSLYNTLARLKREDRIATRQDPEDRRRNLYRLATHSLDADDPDDEDEDEDDPDEGDDDDSDGEEETDADGDETADCPDCGKSFDSPRERSGHLNTPHTSCSPSGDDDADATCRDREDAGEDDDGFWCNRCGHGPLETRGDVIQHHTRNHGDDGPPAVATFEPTPDQLVGTTTASLSTTS